MAMDSSSSLSQIACARCRAQKLRCSRELPQCARCKKMQIRCAFPEPANRRQVAVDRENRKRDIASVERADERHRPDKRPRVPKLPPASASVSPPREVYRSPTQGAVGSTTSGTNALSSEMHQLFQDTYFSGMFNSSLTFHRPTFERDFANGNVPNHVLQAMYAMAACLLLEKSLHLFGGDIKTHSMSWALQSAKEALQSIDQPTLPGIQTCLILALFWFSHGDYRRNTMFSGIAYRGARCMIQDMGYESQDHSRWLECEQVRRCFWAAWQIRNVDSDQYAVGTSIGPYIMVMELPVSEEAFLKGQRETAETLKGERIGGPPSLMAEFMRLVVLWARVRDYIDTRRTASTWTSAFEVYAELTDLQNSLHPSLIYSKRNLYNFLIIKNQPICLLLYAFHHQSSLVLHSSLIPSLSGDLSQDQIPQHVVRISAELALEHAQALAAMARDLLSLEWEFNKIAPFVGYAMYVAAAVLLVVMRGGKGSIETAKKDLVCCLRLLKGMKGHWKMLEQLWERLQSLHELKIGKEPVLDAAHCSPSDGLTESTGNVNEVLTDSVLYFSLRKLERSPSQTSPAKMSTLDEYVSLASQDQIPNLLSPSNQNYNTACIAIPQGQDESPASTMNMGYPISTPQTQPPIANFDHWWEWNPLNTEAQGQISFDDLFGMDLTFQ